MSHSKNDCIVFVANDFLYIRNYVNTIFLRNFLRISPGVAYNNVISVFFK